MKLYDIPKMSKIKEETFSGSGKKIGDWITFYHIDGAYSYCKNENGDVVHLLASTDLVENYTPKDGTFYTIK